ncbi:hypothetical protein CHARACLAT_010488 [Characodon lateralis]|uniref:Secreted protein n=1 Tax=Characodon lateralis TaxID=208331 RepID=A0ABU7D8G8_9TELE|nr:hypothetical protein [Characodon lateralis]
MKSDPRTLPIHPPHFLFLLCYSPPHSSYFCLNRVKTAWGHRGAEETLLRPLKSVCALTLELGGLFCARLHQCCPASLEGAALIATAAFG